ncbi:hypothetical protein TrST_g13663 [Triparma strigata]|uniref:Uncharacterized protein n=1 Tax=Triparma strigata TaxID=1606541 RepID=A0A9W7BHL0_9STRA|nr:hypothetical protein TrST_g13663 [Triparma strigata]
MELGGRDSYVSIGVINDFVCIFTSFFFRRLFETQAAVLSASADLTITLAFSPIMKFLLAESIAPWRTLRLFTYTSFGSGAFLGLLITLSNLAAPDNMKTSDPDSNLPLNALINFIAVSGFAAAGYFDVKKGKELEGKVDDKFARKLKVKEEEMEAKIVWNGVKDEKVVMNGGEFSLKELKTKRLSIVFISGSPSYLKETLLSAKLSKNVIKTNGLILSLPSNKSFEKVEEYVGYYSSSISKVMDVEVKKAKEQGAKVEEGVVVVLGKNGKVVRRGIGRVDWRKIGEDCLEKE